MTTDAVLDENNNYDISFDENGDIKTDDSFDTSILYSVFGERRAPASLITEPQLRRGWIGNVNSDYENGSLLWTYSQSRVTFSALRGIEDDAKKSLQWLVDDGYAVAMDDVISSVKSGIVTLSITIRRSRDKIDRRLYQLWENTGK